jgi:hypothetical protein
MATMPWRKRGPRSTRGGARATVKVRTFGCASSWRSERSVNRRPTRDIDACSRIHAAPNSRMLDCLDPRRRLERLVEKAVDYRLRAGELAVKRSALAEAICTATPGVEVATRTAGERPPASAGAWAPNGHGPGADGGSQDFRNRQRAVLSPGARTVPTGRNSAQLFPIIYGQFLFYLTSGELSVALEIAEGMLELATRSGDRTSTWIGHYMIGVARLKVCNGARDLAARFGTLRR